MEVYMKGPEQKGTISLNEDIVADKSEQSAPQGPSSEESYPSENAAGVKGDDGYEWLEFPENSGKHFYRAPGAESWETWDN